MKKLILTIVFSLFFGCAYASPNWVMVTSNDEAKYLVDTSSVHHFIYKDTPITMGVYGLYINETKEFVTVEINILSETMDYIETKRCYKLNGIVSCRLSDNNDYQPPNNSVMEAIIKYIIQYNKG